MDEGRTLAEEAADAPLAVLLRQVLRKEPVHVGLACRVLRETGALQGQPRLAISRLVS
jgi:hypothetical protein